MASVDAVRGIVRRVNRSNIFEDVIDMYREGDIVGEFPIYIIYEGERGVDEGGVQRDMFSAFWEEAYTRFFEGATTLVPMVHPQIDMSIYPILGRVISHGYLASGILPDRITLPSLISILLGNSVHLPGTVLMDAFIDYISTTERDLLKKAINGNFDKFPSELLNEIMCILSKFGCRQIPKPATLIDIIEQVAKYELCTMPAAAITLLSSGVPLNHQSFWAKKSPADIQSLHHRLTATPLKVISFLDSGTAHNPSEERITSYLTTMIGNMQPSELRLFLRFVTGASVCISSKIRVTFNNLVGLGRRPIAHTCDSSLELSTSYANYEDFYSDFKVILSATKNEFSWRMDAI